MESIGNITNPPGIHSTLRNQTYIANFRVQKIQTYLKNCELDGVLIINGIDSKYSVDARKLTYMLFGYISQYKGSTKDPPVDIDDTIILIEVDKVHIYMPPSAYSDLFPIINGISNLVLYCLDTDAEFSMDTLEDYKVYSFIEMTSNTINLGIPFSNSDKENFDFMKIEKWPMLQAYAFEAYGQHGFFTVTHDLKVFDYLECFKGFDGASLIQVLSNTVSVFLYQWDVFIRNLLNVTNIGLENVNCLFDSLQSYVNHGNKSKGYLKSHIQKHATDGSLLFVSCIVQEPQGSVQAARSYFVHSNLSSDLTLLSCIYDSMVHAGHQTIQRYLSSRNSSKLSAYFTKKFQEKSASHKYSSLSSLNFKQLKLDITVSIEYYDTVGDKVSGDSSISSLKYLQIQINKIPSLEKAGMYYNNMLFGETFVDSYLKVKSGEEFGIDSDHIVVTDNIPTYIQTNPSSDKKDRIPCTLLNYNSKDIYDASFQLSDSAFQIYSEYSPQITIDLSNVKTVIVNRSGSVSILVYMEYTSLCLAPFNKRVAVAFWQRGKGYKFCLDTLLPLLKNSNIETKTEGIPKNITLRFEKYMMFRSKSSDKELLSTRYPTLPSFLPHYNLNCVGDFTYPQADINPSIQAPAKPNVFVTIVIGIPGSHQDEIASVIAKGSKNDKESLILRQLHGAKALFSLHDLQNSLEKIVIQNEDEVRVVVVVNDYVEINTVVDGIVNHPNPTVQSRCSISCVNCCIDARNIFLCNQTPFPKVMEQLREGWVNNVIVSGLPKSKEKVMSFLKATNPSARIIQFISKQILDVDDLNAACSKDSFYEGTLAFKRHINTPGWWCQKYQRKAPYISIDYITMRFKGALCKARLMVQLKKLHQKEGRVFLDRLLMSGSVFYIRGHVKMIDDRKSYEVIYCPRSDAISLSVMKDVSENSFSFTGYKLSQEQLKEWLQNCAPKSPTKKALFTKETLESSDLQTLHERELGSPLPPGWFYNGLTYVSMDGEKRSNHPNYETIVKAYLEEKNRDIVKYNEDAGNFTETVLF